MSATVLQGDCIERMAEMEEASVDAIVCDPPYGLSREPDISEVLQHWLASDDYKHRGGGFMGQSWDSFVPGPAYWTAAFRLLKPGGHLLAFAGSRTVDLMGIAIRMAGFEIRDSLMWIYGSGFPKSHDVSKAIDRAAGVEREAIGPRRWAGRDPNGTALDQMNDDAWEAKPDEAIPATAPATPEAAEWKGWGTALKPSHEPIVVARKPLTGTVAENVQAHGTGGINVDGCRVGWGEEGDKLADRKAKGYSEAAKRALGGVAASESKTGFSGEVEGSDSSSGRWPANVVLSHTPLCEPVGTRIVKGDRHETGDGQRPRGFADVGAENGDGEPNAPVHGDEEIVEWDCAPGCPVAALDAQTGELTSGKREPHHADHGKAAGTLGAFTGAPGRESFGDSGGASRFFYVAKTSRAERNAGLEGFEERVPDNAIDRASQRQGEEPAAGRGSLSQPRANVHPTVKPIALMRWLCRLVAPPGGLILDPFLGSGSTGCAAVLEGFDFIGIEREAEYVAIAEARIAFWSQHEGSETKDVLKASKKRKPSDPAQQQLVAA